MGLKVSQSDALLSQWLKGAQDTERQSQAGMERFGLQGREEGSKLEQLIKGHDLKQQALKDNIQRAQGLAKQQGLEPGKYSMTASEGGVGINPENDDMLRMLQMQNLQQQRDEESVRKLEKRSADAGTAQAAPALQRGEEAIPGLFTGGKPELKSVGGIKSLAPNWSVPILEKAGIMPEGAGAERTALQELQNIKLYDSSGKAINENEMKRIQDAMGLRGVFEPQEILNSLQQMGYTVLEKQKGVTAGAPERIVQKFEGAGGLAGKKSIADLIGATAKSQQQPSGLDPAKAARLKELRAKKAAGQL